MLYFYHRREIMNLNNVFERVVGNMQAAGFLSYAEAYDLLERYRRYLDKLRADNSVSSVNETGPDISAQPARERPDTYMPPLPDFQPARYAPPPARAPAVRTREQIRERNISWILNIGVILLLISGVIFATTTWHQFSNPVKVILLSCVILFFFAVSIFSQKILKIPKTATAFWIMGSLFLPVMMLSVGFFRVAGNYFSLFGEGRFLYGTACAFICLPVFVYSTYRYNSRLFSWLSLSAFSLLFAFAVASFYPPNMILAAFLFAFNALLLPVRWKFPRDGRAALFLRDLGIFLPLNLLITMLVTMTDFSGDLLYSVNVLFISLIIFGLSVTEKHSFYDYAAALVFFIGICLLGDSVGGGVLQLLLISSIGIVFCSVSFCYREGSEKRLRYTVFSALSGGLIFLYLSGFYIPFIADSRLLVYTAMSCLAMLTLHSLFLYRVSGLKNAAVWSPVQLFIFLYEFLLAVRLWTDFEWKLEYLLSATLVVFIMGYGTRLLNRHTKLRGSLAICSLLSALIIFIWSSAQAGIVVSPSVALAALFLQIFVIWFKNIENGLGRFVRFLLPVVMFGALCLVRQTYSIDTVSAPVFNFCSASLVFLTHFFTIKKLRPLRLAFFYMGHVVLAATLLPLLLSGNYLIYKTEAVLLMLVAYGYSFISEKREKLSHLWLNAGIISTTILLYNIAEILYVYAGLSLTKYVLYANGFLLLAFFFQQPKDSFRKNIAVYLGIICFILAVGNFYAGGILWYEFAALLIFTALTCFALSKTNWNYTIILPLILYISGLWLLLRHSLSGSLLSVAVTAACAALLLLAGRVGSPTLFSRARTDYYSLAALLSILLLPYRYHAVNLKAVEVLIPGVLGCIWFILNRKRFWENDTRPGTALFAVSLLWPYYSLLSAFTLPGSVFFIAYLSPLVVLTYACVKWIYRELRLYPVEHIVPGFCYIAALIRLFISSDLTEAVILGLFGLLLLLYGQIFKTRSALFMGGGLILSSALIETRSFWLNIQWWVYLAVVGGILIITASVNEYYKNKTNDNLILKLGRFFDKFGDWN